eukprot:scaffold56727_cov40-Phaeocystis_antarctica.AAC.3
MADAQEACLRLRVLSPSARRMTDRRVWRENVATRCKKPHARYALRRASRSRLGTAWSMMPEFRVYSKHDATNLNARGHWGAGREDNDAGGVEDF